MNNKLINSLATGNAEITPRISDTRCQRNNKGFLTSSSCDLSIVSDLKFKLCSSALCKTCPMANPIQINNNATHYFCKVYKCIYSITCGVCNMKYVGQTSNPLHLRINVHRNHISKYVSNNNSFSNQVEYEHYNKHNFDSAIINILGIIPNLTDRLFIENKLILKHSTIYPYGLNQIYNHINYANYAYTPDYSQPTTFAILNKPKLYNHRFKRGKKSGKYPQKSKEQITLELKELNTNFNISFNVKSVKNYVFSIRKNSISLYYSIFRHLLNNNSFSTHFKTCFYDLIIHRSISVNKYLTNNEVNDNKIYCTISYSSKTLDYIDFNNVFNKFNNYMPIHNTNIVKAFKYNIPFGRKLFNYNKVSKSLISDSKCECSSDPFKKFIDPIHKHVVTGNLDIVDNIELKNIMAKGTKYRLPYFISKDKIMKNIELDLERFIYRLACKFSYPINAFEEWKSKVLNYIKAILPSPFKSYSYSSKIQTEIDKLHKHLVITYVDKANNNYAFICKEFYVNTLKNSILNSNNLKQVNSSGNQILKKINNLHQLIGIKPNNSNFPYIVLVPKFHKNPIAFRTVTVAYNSYNKTSSQLLLKELKFIEEQIKQSGTFSYLNNSFELKNQLEQVKNVYQIKTFDFKDLFNNIKLKDLKTVISYLSKKFNSSMNNRKFNSLFNLVVNNNYIMQGEYLYIQNQGVPQGGNASSLLANLYLYFYESVLQPIDTNILTFRYIDDLIILSLNSNINIDSPTYYPDNLILTQNNSVGNIANFLDLKIDYNNNDIIFDIYDKTIAYNFKVHKMQHYTSLMHKSVFKNIIKNYLSRIQKLCSPSNVNNQINNLNKIATDNCYPVNYVKSLIAYFNFNYN